METVPLPERRACVLQASWETVPFVFDKSCFQCAAGLKDHDLDALLRELMPIVSRLLRRRRRSPHALSFCRLCHVNLSLTVSLPKRFMPFGSQSICSAKPRFDVAAMLARKPS